MILALITLAIPVLLLLPSTPAPMPLRLLLGLGAGASLYWLHDRGLRNLHRQIRSLQRKSRQAEGDLARTHLEMLGMRELDKALARPGDLQAAMDRVLAHCHRKLGFAEVMLLRMDGAEGALRGRWLRPGANGPTVDAVHWPLGTLGGTLHASLRTCRSYRVQEARQFPLVVGPEQARLADENAGYLVVPLISTTPQPACLQEGWLFKPGCPSFVPRELAAPPPGGAEPGDLAASACLDCRHFPVLGAIAVTEAQREDPIDSGEQRVVETLAASVSNLLESVLLYNQVRTAERYREQILDGMTNGLVTTDRNGVIVLTNRRAQTMTHVSDEELVGQPLHRLLEVPGTPSPLGSVLDGKVPDLHAEGFLRTGGGSGDRLPVRLRVSPLKPEGGVLQGAVCVFEDLSDLRALEEELRHLDKLAAIGRFASSLAHEIRNPLGGISAGVQFLARSSDLDEDGLANIDVIQGEVERLDGIIRNLFSVARPTPLQLESVDPRQVITRAVRSLEHWAGELGIALRCETAEELPEIYLDRDLLHQVLVNLIKNAVEASPGGSVVHVEVKAPRWTSMEDSEADGVVFSVRDQGEGIDELDLPHIFEPFYSRKSAGTGLGLFVCHSTIQRHGGRIHVESRPGRGTSFEVQLPRTPALVGGRHEQAHSHH